MQHRLVIATVVLVLLLSVAIGVHVRTSASPVHAAAGAATTAPADAGDAAAPIRLSGTVEAVRARTVFVPRLTGQAVNTLVITKLARAGSRVAVGDLLVEFDPQSQIQAALDRKAEVVDLDGQIGKMKADQAVARAQDETALTTAEHDVDRARYATLSNGLLPRITAERNNLALEQAIAQIGQLKATFDLKRRAEAADLRVLEIRRARSEAARVHAEANIGLMAVRATFPGVAVLKTIFKGSSMGEVQEGDQVRPGLPIVDIIDPTAMQIRARVNQADIAHVAAGQSARIRFDAYPELAFDGRVEIVSPLAVTSNLTDNVRFFTALVSIHGMDSQLMPDLTASVDVLPGVPTARASQEKR